MMPITPGKRVSNFKESVTLKLNAKAVSLAKEGKEIYNLTAGQLPFKPEQSLVDGIVQECNFLSSYQYSPVAGNTDLRKKIIKNFEQDNSLSLEGYDCIISNGAKQSISNVLCSIINPGDEVIIFTPYWVSYPPLIELFGGVVKVVECDFFDGFEPSKANLEKVITNKTRAVIVNSPSNPSGVVYSNEWMEGFAKVMIDHPNITILSDEIYRELFYYDPAPSYFYHHEPSLLERTIIINGASKTMAATGLRIGWAIAPKDFVSTLSKLQGQLTSGANSLCQSALANYDFSKTQGYLTNVKNHLRDNAKIVRDKFIEGKLSHKWYQTRGAFYFIIDFNKLPIHLGFIKDEDDETDYSNQICELLLRECGVACVPGGDFGLKNSARISLVSNKTEFSEAIDRIVRLMTKSPTNQ